MQATFGRKGGGGRIVAARHGESVNAIAVWLLRVEIFVFDSCGTSRKVHVLTVENGFTNLWSFCHDILRMTFISRFELSIIAPSNRRDHDQRQHGDFLLLMHHEIVGLC